MGNLHPDYFLGPLVDLQRLMAHFGCRAMITGDVAASLLGAPRMSSGIAVLVLLSKEELPELFKAAQAEGIFPRIPEAVDFAAQHNLMLLVHRASGINLDISLGMLPFEREAVERSIEYKPGDLMIRLPTPEDLVIFKAVAHRPEDIMDIQEIVRAAPALDVVRIKDWLEQFAEVLEAPEIWDDVKGFFE